jgi:hypothetical protein
MRRSGRGPKARKARRVAAAASARKRTDSAISEKRVTEDQRWANLALSPPGPGGSSCGDTTRIGEGSGEEGAQARYRVLKYRAGYLWVWLHGSTGGLQGCTPRIGHHELHK